MHLAVRDLSKAYPNGTQALKHVSLDVPPGMFGLLGPNGAGKSTLMRIIATLQEPDEGSIRLVDSSTGPGQGVDVLQQKEEVRRTLGYLPQSFGFYPNVRADRLLEHFAVLKGIAETGTRRDVVESLLRRTHLWEARKQRLGTFPGGMRQRFGVAVALLGNPKLIIVDEPTEGLDPAERVRFLDLLAEIGQDRIVILSTHSVEDVEAVCSRVAIIDRGEILRVEGPVLSERTRVEGPVPVDVAPGPGRPVPIPRVAGTFGLETRARQTLAVARTSLEEIAASRGFVAALVVGIGLVLLWGWNVGSTAFDGSAWPVTHFVAETVLSVRIAPIIFLLTAVYAGELVWRDRDAGVAEIADAAPVPEGVALLGRFLALVAILAAFQAALMAGGVLLQALQGYYHFELGLYLRILFGLNLANQAILAALAMTVHVIVNQKYAGHIVVMMAFLFTVVADQLGIRHHLLVYGTGPGWTYSDMNGFGPFIGPFVSFTLYWAAWALLLSVIANLFWVRGREPGLRRRLRVARARFSGPARGVATVAISLIVVVGGFIFHNTNILNAHRAPGEAEFTQAEYERRFRRFEDSPQPVIVDAELRVEIYPEKPAVDMRGSYRLVNRTGAAIDSVHVYLDPKVEMHALSLERAPKPQLADADVGYRIYKLERALEPDGSLRLWFDLSYRPLGFPNSEIPTDLVGNGAYFNREWMPIIGYQPALELTDDAARRRFGLAALPPLTSADAAARRYRSHLRDADIVHVDAIVGTAADQIAVTPGVLRRSWAENGRRYFHYQTDSPTGFDGSVFSGRYAVFEDRWQDLSRRSGEAAKADIALQIFHHPPHGYVLDRMVRSMKASLEYYTGQFGPYPDRQLRIVEIPRYGRFFGRAHPHTIAVTEDNFLSRVDEGTIDQPFYGTAHEIAHQWWGGQVRGAAVRGRDSQFLTESLAGYSAMMVMEKAYGPETARRVYDFQMERYLQGRAFRSREVPLLEMDDQTDIAYRKGAIAMYTLREQIGEDAVNTALRRYLEKHRDAGPPYPTPLDLYAELRAVTPESLQTLLSDLFETVTLWDVRTERARVAPIGTGEYRITMDVVGRKLRADGAGKETEVPMDDLVEIGVFAPGAGHGPGAPLYLQRHRIRTGTQTITVTVPREPARAGIDPYRKLIDREGKNNVVALGSR